MYPFPIAISACEKNNDRYTDKETLFFPSFLPFRILHNLDARRSFSRGDFNVEVPQPLFFGFSSFRFTRITAFLDFFVL